MYKFMILTDSAGQPRSFPPSEMVHLEETYPYLIRNQFKDSVFWQLSYGNMTASELVSQPIGYLSHWKPDFIIVQAGMADCRPEPFSEFEKAIISKFTWKFFGKLKKYFYHPALIKRRQLYRVSKNSFRKTIMMFKLIFPEAKIIWLEICAQNEYEQVRPGITRRMVEYNEIIQKVYGEGFLSIRNIMLEAKGYNIVDHGHWNKRGHQAVGNLLIEKINSYLNTSVKI